MFDPRLWSLPVSLLLFVGAVVVIAVGGVIVTRRAEQLARHTGLGQALTGALFLGAMTSLPGLVASLTAAFEHHPQLAVSNAIGGIAAQTAFLAIADMVYRKANLEHAAASEENLLQGAVLIMLLAIPLLGMSLPGWSVWGVHPGSLVLIAAYVFGMRLIAGAHRVPMWAPRRTSATQRAEPSATGISRRRLSQLWLGFVAIAVLVVIAGWVVANASIAISVHTGISESAVGTVFTAISTSLPELVIAVAAVRRGALTLAVGDIIGGNTFDVLFLAFSDLVYRPGSIYHAVAPAQLTWMVLSILMTTILLTGLLRRQRHGIANIGFESFLVLVAYGVGLVSLGLGT